MYPVLDVGFRTTLRFEASVTRRTHRARVNLSMPSTANLSITGRDRRLDLFRGIANWAIFLDHIPNNVVAWITIRNYGFSDAAELFIFMSGYMTSLVCVNMMRRRGFVAGSSWLIKRVWQLYVAHIFLFVMYMAVIGHLAQSYDNLELINEFNVSGLLGNPFDLLTQGLLLRFKPLNMDVLPLYIVLMASMPPVLWLMLRLPDCTMIGSLGIYLAARHFGWNLSAYPNGVWYFNPFTWQLLFVLGGWLAICGARRLSFVIHSKSLLYIGAGYLLFSLVMTMSDHIPSLANWLPKWLFDAFNPNDKTNLAPYRVIHFTFIALFATRLPMNWRGLECRVFQPLIKCGEQSLHVFCSGVLLSFLAHFILESGSGTVRAQIFVSVAGLSLMTAIAYIASWSRTLDMPRSLFRSGRSGEDVIDTAASNDPQMPPNTQAWVERPDFSYQR